MSEYSIDRLGFETIKKVKAELLAVTDESFVDVWGRVKLIFTIFQI